MTISATTQGLRPGVCTSTSRPSTPFDGQVIYETDTNVLAVYNGSSWVTVGDTDFTPFSSWTSYTPSLTASTTNPNLGSTGSTSGAYMQIGKMVYGRAKFTFGGTGISAGSGVYYLSLPISSAVAGWTIGVAFAQDDSTGARQVLTCWLNNSSRIEFMYDGASGYPGATATAPWVWAANDFLACEFTYEAA